MLKLRLNHNIIVQSFNMSTSKRNKKTSRPPPKIRKTGVPEEMAKIRKHPLEIFPEEVWRIILGNVNNPQAIRNSMKTCTSWEHWLESKRTLVHFRDVLPFVMKFLPKKDFLKCRIVCQTWKNDLDVVYQNHPSNFEPHGIYFRGQWAVGKARKKRILGRGYDMVAGDSDQSWHCNPGPGNTFIDNDELDEFMEAMESHPGNPFPGRFISLRQNDSANHYWDSALPLLDRFGEHVWFASICFKDCTQGQLRHCLERLPNLKMLEISSNKTERSIFEKRSRADKIPLPQMRSLESFVYFGVDLRKSVIDAVFKACTPKIFRRIYLLSRIYFVRTHDGFYNFPNLEVLHANVYIQDLEKFRDVAPPLKKIDLVFRNKEKDKVPFATLFRSLEQFAGTLVDAKLLFHHDDGLVDSPPVSVRVNLPKLERLYIRGYRGALDPLLQLNALKYLKVDFKDSRADGSVLWEKLVPAKGTDIANDIPKSQIWRLMPSLQKLSLHTVDPDTRRYIGGEYYRLNLLEGNLKIRR